MTKVVPNYAQPTIKGLKAEIAELKTLLQDAVFHYPEQRLQQRKLLGLE